MGKNDRYVVKGGDGWEVKAANAKRASAKTPTQAAAEKRAKEIVGKQGGGEVRIQGRNGRWRDSDTVPPGNESRAKDTRH